MFPQAKKVFGIALGWAMKMYTASLSSNLISQYDSYFHSVNTALLAKKHFTDLYSV